MANRLKEDEKNERIIRGLLKLQENRRCINCGSLGPQYVCTNFWTFVCTNCGGIHREFTHRVKSISMAKFTSQEVNALQEGGNQRAKEIYFKEWDPQRHSLPDSSNIDRLRDFIKHVYVDRRYSGERTYDKPPRGKMGDKDDFYENRRVEAYQGGSKSPQYEDAHERRYSDRSSPGGRSPGYDQESRQYGDYRRSPGRPPIINDWRREDRFADQRSSDGDYKLEGQSPEHAKDFDSSSSPVVRPVRDILGENVVPLRISEPPKTNSGKPADGSALTQRTASSSSLASSNGNAAEVKLETTKSLIDFDAEPEPPVAPAIPQAQQTTAVQSAVQRANSSDDNWASFDVAPAAKTTQVPSNLSPLESVLSQLAMPSPAPAPAPAPVQVSGVQGPLPVSAVTATAVGAGAGTLRNFSSVPPSGTSVTAPGLMTAPSISNAGQWASMQHNQPVFPATASHPTTQQFIPSAGGSLNSQQWGVSPVPTMQGHPSIQMPHASSLISKPTNEVSSGAASLPSKEVQPSGRKELPEDLFTARYSSFTSPAPGWQVGPPHGMGIYMQYNTAAHMPSFPQSSKSTNPFDVSSEPPPIQAPTFPSMSSMQGALLSIPPSSGVIHPPSVGSPSLSWRPPQSSYGSVLPPQAQVHAPAMAPRAYVGQQVPTNMPMPRHQEIGNSGAQGAAFGISNPDQQITGMFSTAAAANSFSAGGNPFG